MKTRPPWLPASKHIVVDDFDASTDDVGTYHFALEGVEYEIDLSAPNLQRLRTALRPFIHRRPAAA